jgi:hypothetical protein
MDRCYLAHAHQTEPYGCLWHAAFALTGETWMLDHTREINTARYLALLAERGWLDETVWRVAAHPGNFMPAKDLEWYLEPAAHQTDPNRRFMTLALGLDFGRLLHRVAVQLPADPLTPHWISDSLKHSIGGFGSRREFLESRYGSSIVTVSQIVSARVDHYRPMDALEGLQRTLKDKNEWRFLTVEQE